MMLQKQSLSLLGGIETRAATKYGYTLVETETLMGIADTQVTPETKNYEGFTAPEKKTITIT